MNWYPETNEGQGQSASTLLPTPGLSIFCTLPGISVRGEFSQNGRAFAVSGNGFIEIMEDGTTNQWGTVAVDQNPVSMDGFGPSNQILIASAGVAYVFDTSMNVLTPVDPTTLSNVSQVCMIDGFFIALLKGGSTFQVSNPADASTWDDSNTAIISVYGDDTVSMIPAFRQIIFLGQKRGVAYYDSGNVFPFDVVVGGFIEQGAIATWATAFMDNSVFWLSGDSRGSGMVFRANGYTPQRVSNHAIEFAMQGYFAQFGAAALTSCISYTYQDQGHTFLVMYFPLPNTTWVYDAGEQNWHERGFWTGAAFTAHNSQCHMEAFGMHLVGDWNSGNVYQMAIPSPNLTGGWNFVTDFGNVIRRIRRAPHIANEKEWMFHQYLQVDVETGLGPSPGILQPFIAPATIQLTVAEGTNIGRLINVGVADDGSFTDVVGAIGTAPPIYLNTAGFTGNSWQLTVESNITPPSFTIFGSPVAYSAAYPTAIPLQTPSGLQAGFVTGTPSPTNTDVTVNPDPPLGLYRGPLMMMRFSDDGAHTWSNIQTVDCGQAGNFKARAKWYRLGQSRDRVYEISVTDPIPWRIIDAYAGAAPGYQPSSRIADNIRKVS